MIQANNINLFIDTLSKTDHAASLLGKNIYDDLLLKRLLENVKILKADAMQSEIENNLYFLNNKETRTIYVKNTLRKFLTIFPYYDVDGEVAENTFHPLFTNDNVKNVEISINYIQSTESWEQDPDSGFYDTLPVPERFIIASYYKLLEFSLKLEASLLTFDLCLESIQESMGVFLSRATNNSYVLAMSGFTLKETETLFPLIEPEPIISTETAGLLRKQFDGIIWEKEQITDEEFRNYWYQGVRRKPLPILEGQISTFLYLYFTHINIEANGKFKIKHPVTESIFGITDVKGKKGKINPSSEGSRNVRKVLGSSLL